MGDYTGPDRRLGRRRKDDLIGEVLREIASNIEDPNRIYVDHQYDAQRLRNLADTFDPQPEGETVG